MKSDDHQTIEALQRRIGELQRHLAEQARQLKTARYNEERFRKAVALLPQVVFETDCRGDITFVNENAFDVFGYERGDLDRGLNVIPMLVPEDRNRATENFPRALGGEQLGGVEYTALRKDGSTFPVLIYSRPIVRDGVPIGLRGMVIDITRLKQVEDELREHREELEKLVRQRTASLEEANRRLRSSEQKLRRQARALEKKNIAMREIIEQIEMEKSKIKDDMAANVNEVIMPLISRVEVSGENRSYLDLIRYYLEELVTSFGRKITEKSLRLTPREIEICAMVKGGLRSKEIARLLNISYLTVVEHRRNIRRKLGLAGSNINLTSYLQQL